MLAVKQWAPILGELVAILRRFGERDIDEDTATPLEGMSAATHDAVPGPSPSANSPPAGRRTAAWQGRKWVLAALDGIAKVDAVPDPGRRQRHWIGVHQPSPAGMVRERQITCARSRPGNKNDGCHVEQKNWAIVRSGSWWATTATTPKQKCCCSTRSGHCSRS
jgi:hypothetical protein